uniref:Serpentine receptor class gamma n=1 Tax=Meloidogyne enterolobii TaxID=390850 RepID=A0A6V7W1U8_MELEN|nr:unnamed protein product [Meloidogyne enterolobii]
MFNFLSSYTFIGDNLSTFFMMLNRFIAIAWAFNYEKKIHRIACFLCFALPLNCIGMLSIRYTYFTVRDDKNENIISINIIELNNEGRLNFYIQLSTIEAIFFLFAFIIINLLTIFAYKKKIKNIIESVKVAGTKNSDEKIERKLWLIALISSFGQMLMATAVIMLYVLNKSSRVLLNYIYSIVMDIGIIILPSWPLICFSQTFRNKLLRTILPEKLYKKFIGSMKQLQNNTRCSKNN